jgi:hypothetical protein
MQEAWSVDVKFRRPDGTVQRVQQASPVNTRRGAEQHERQIRECLQSGTYGKETKEVPTFESFSVKFLTHAKTNNKYSTLKSKDYILRKHLVPTFGRKRLDRSMPTKSRSTRQPSWTTVFLPRRSTTISPFFEKC